MDTLFELGIQIAPAGSGRSSLYEQLKGAIADGRLKPGMRMPPTRRAEACFAVSRTTLVEVYGRLVSEGYLATRHGSGTFVAERPPPSRTRAARRTTASTDERLNGFWVRPEVRSAMAFWRDSSGLGRGETLADFRPGFVDPRLFPFQTFRRMMAKQLRWLEIRPTRFRSPQGNQGSFQLRSAITDHVAQTRAVAADPDDVLITAGAQQAFDLLARVLVTAGRTVVAVEDPGYPPMRVAFAAAGAKVVPVGVDHEGLIVERLPEDVRIISLCPSHQFPLGVTMSARRRRALIGFARTHGAVIIEDDYDGEFRLDGAPVEALRTGAAAEDVFYVGTFSKCMLPALRLGFIIVPHWAMGTLITAKNCLDWHCPVPEQLAVARFISEGHLALHVRKLRQLYGERRELIRQLLTDHFAGWLEPIPSACGMHVSAASRTPRDFEPITERLMSRGVKVHALGRYFIGEKTRDGLIFGYGATDLSEIEAGLTELRAVLASRA